MAGINAQQVYLPSPDQSPTTGAVAVAPIGTAAVTDARSPLSSEWSSGGYIDENGVSMSISKSFNGLRDWSQSLVRNALSEYEGTLSMAFLQIDEFAMTETFGASAVTATGATNEHGNILSVAIGPTVPEVKAWCFSMKDEDRRVRIYIPRGQITEISGDVTFVPGEANVYGVTLATYDDGTGNSIYVIYDDGAILSDGPTQPSVTLSQHTATLDAEATRQLTATVVPEGTAVVWASDNDTVATVADGLVTAVAEGTANITATITVDGTDYTDTCVVTVRA